MNSGAIVFNQIVFLERTRQNFIVKWRGGFDLRGERMEKVQVQLLGLVDFWAGWLHWGAELTLPSRALGTNFRKGGLRLQTSRSVFLDLLENFP